MLEYLKNVVILSQFQTTQNIERGKDIKLLVFLGALQNYPVKLFFKK